MTGLGKQREPAKEGWCEMMKLKIISGDIVRKVVSMSQAIVAVREAYIQLSTGRAVLPLRIQVPVKKHNGITLFMPAYLSESKALGAKIVSVFPGNARKRLPTIFAAVIVVDSETGQPQALIDGSYLTALRTGAASGVATELLSRPDSRAVAIIGAGIQARTQLEAVCTVRKIEKVRVYDCLLERAHAFVEEMKARGSLIPENITAVDSPAHAVSEADIICAATTSSSPVFVDKDLSPGVHINGVGSYIPEMQEIPPETVVRAKVVVDSRTACLEEAGDLIIPIKEGLIDEGHIHAEIGEIAVGKVSGRESEDEITFFKSVGLAVQDVAVAELVWQKARERGLGLDVEL